MADNTLFDLVAIPEQLDRDTLFYSLLDESNGLEVLYPDPVFCKRALATFGQRMLPNWQKMVDAISADYDILHNYDRTEIWKDRGSNDDVTSGQRDSSSRSTDGTKSETATTTNSTDTGNTNNMDAGWNSQDLVNNNLVTNNNSTDAKGNGSTNSLSSSEGDATESSTETHNGSHSLDREGRVYGNIGVTTSQQMLQSEIDFRHNNNPYDIIIHDIINKFCILIY